MKIIDLLNKIANGEEVPKKIRIDHWCYVFEWIEHDENYYDKHEDIDLMSCLSMSQEELNYNVQIIEEDKEIEKITINNNGTLGFPNGCWTARNMDKAFAVKINELIDEINKLKENNECKR